jgi:hypothetical protein
MIHLLGDHRLRWLEANADKAKVQELIRQEIARGMIRIIPGPGDTIRIIPRRPDAGPAQRSSMSHGA